MLPDVSGDYAADFLGGPCMGCAGCYGSISSPSIVFFNC